MLLNNEKIDDQKLRKLGKLTLNSKSNLKIIFFRIFF